MRTFIWFFIIFVILDLFLSFIFKNPFLFLLIIVAIVAYGAYRNYQRQKQIEQFQEDIKQQFEQANNYYENNNSSADPDIIDVKYTEKEIEK